MSEGCLGYNIQNSTIVQHCVWCSANAIASSESYTGSCQEARNISGGKSNVCLPLPDMGATVPAFHDKSHYYAWLE